MERKDFKTKFAFYSVFGTAQRGSNQMVHLAMSRKWIEIGSRDDERMRGSTASKISPEIEYQSYRPANVVNIDLEPKGGNYMNTVTVQYLPWAVGVPYCLPPRRVQFDCEKVGISVKEGFPLVIFKTVGR